MDNNAIADQFSLLGKLMDIHGENSFKSKSYSVAAFTIEKLPHELADLPAEKIFKIKGIGDAIGKKILEILENGQLRLLQEYLEKTPEGVLEMMNIKGIGPKKINTIWKELEIETIEDLELACQENIISSVKGFGVKTQDKILESIAFQKSNEGKYLYAQLEHFVEAFIQKLNTEFPKEKFAVTGAFRRQLEIIDILEFVTTTPKDALIDFLENEQIQYKEEENNSVSFIAQSTLSIKFHLTTIKDFTSALFNTSCSEEFLSAFKKENSLDDPFEKEEVIFSAAQLHFIPPYQRETVTVIKKAKQQPLPSPLQVSDIKGLIHSHSNWSDGGYTIEAMAEDLINKGFEYLVISDHSKAAYYANGLSEEKIKEQHKYIDSLNKKFAPFKIFKSIECDILSDGRLDYSNDVLSTFDLVIASIHSNLEMPEQKAMQRLLGAITNPYVTILGHMTGRVLLKRNSYPVVFKTIIDACAENKVVIEINASPKRLDMPWQWVEYALEKNVILSINPDAHTLDEFEFIKYGTLVAQKGGLTKEQNLSSKSLKEFEAFLKENKKISS